jgi:hypothetical protein
MSDGGTGGADLEVMYMPVDDNSTDKDNKHSHRDLGGSFVGTKVRGDEELISKYQCEIY